MTTTFLRAQSAALANATSLLCARGEASGAMRKEGHANLVECVLRLSECIGAEPLELGKPLRPEELVHLLHFLEAGPDVFKVRLEVDRRSNH